MEAIAMLKQDHKVVERLFKQFDKAGDDAYAERPTSSSRLSWN
jgi:hypothetical protein